MSTILFMDDWKKFPTAIIDTKTKNESFIRLSALYRDMGVKNHAFPLALINPSLQGVDPHDPNLSDETIAAIVVECKLNFWYYIREVARAPGRSGGDPVPFRASRGNIALYWLFFNHITTILIQIRQSGKSFGMDTLNRYLLNIRCRSTTIVLITKDETLRSENLARLKEIEDVLPFYLKLRTRNDLANTEELTIRALNNKYIGLLCQKSPKAALNLGRGLTTPIVQFDEAAFLANIAISLPAALAAGTAARDIARQNDEPYGTVLTTTAGKKNDRDGAYVYKIVEDAMVWSESLFDAIDITDLEKLIRKSSPNGELIVNCTFSHRQLGLSDSWLERTLEETRSKGEDADRDFFNIWTSGSQSSPFPPDLAEIVAKSKIDDFYSQIASPYPYVLRWYCKEDEIKQVMNSSFFIASIDSSDAVGSDEISLTFTDIRTGEIVAAGNFNETNIITFCEWLVTLFVDYEKFVMIIERRSTGSSILDYLLLMLPLKGIDPFRRLYNKVVQNYDEDPETFKQIDCEVYARNSNVNVALKRFFGFATSGSGITSRSELYGTTLINSVKETGHCVRDGKLIKQLLALEIRNGRVDHPVGEHDDLVISWLMARWLMFNGKNLSFYGINPKDIMSRSTRRKPEGTVQDRFIRHEQEILRRDIEALIELMSEESDEFIVRKYEHKLRTLASRLILQETEHFSIDSLMESLREQRKVQHSHNRVTNAFYDNSGGIYQGYR